MLNDCLRSLANQQTAAEFTYEIVVVDNNSSDDTAEVVARVQAECLPGPATAIRYVKEITQGRVHARHRGLDEARGEWIANFDDDEVAEPTWLLELVRLAKQKGLRSVGGKLLLRFLQPTDRQLHPRVRRALGESVLWDSPQPYTRRQGPGAGNQLLHRSVFTEVGRYDLSYQKRGEDTDLYRRICAAGIESWFTPNAVAYHLTPNERMSDDYLKTTFLHDGWCFSRRDLEHFGKVRCLPILCARLANSLLVHLPAALLATCRGDRETALAYRLTCQRSLGYLRGYLFHAARRFFPQRRFLTQYRFDE